jgi:hypothetical protein
VFVWSVLGARWSLLYGMAHDSGVAAAIVHATLLPAAERRETEEALRQVLRVRAVRACVRACVRSGAAAAAAARSCHALPTVALARPGGSWSARVPRAIAGLAVVRTL